MKKNILLFGALLAFTTLPYAEEFKIPSGDSKITIPEGYKNFRLLGVSQRSDAQTLRAILGNDVAIESARTGKTQLWPNGTILVKLGWKHQQSDKFPAATIPGEFAGIAVMFKDDVRYAATAGWGWGEWSGTELKPNEKPDFAKECVACHSAVKDQDWVFTRLVKLP